MNLNCYDTIILHMLTTVLVFYEKLTAGMGQT